MDANTRRSDPEPCLATASARPAAPEKRTGCHHHRHDDDHDDDDHHHRDDDHDGLFHHH